MTTSSSRAHTPARPRRGSRMLRVVPTVLVIAATVLTGAVGINLATGHTEPYEAAVDAQVRRERGLPEEQVRSIVDNYVDSVRLPHPRDEELVGLIAKEKQPDAEAVRAAVDTQLDEWNLTPDGTLARNNCPLQAKACVDLENRLAWLQQDGKVTYGPVPTIGGTVVDPTPRGTFTVVWKKIDDYSRAYEVDIPFSVYFTDNGIAFHEGALDEHSHGCLHLAHRDAPTFFDRLEEGDTVVVM
ncbi:L,D-transpeptidase [Corynebacterium sp. TAE3-ERU12]|uniref:L,D-transpeptidase n=1 Tax=Corynebacterium sp. TAE3-ERU12 TaxID=2849491 RepID=UPI001C48E908|nr:L,D-transpeptidase [Corynebacterium sp. TAE3-ERU12]MBV7295818.1 L,D-transpeptidase [Corynebacterium sp. TAE3-ERU12]